MAKTTRAIFRETPTDKRLGPLSLIDFVQLAAGAVFIGVSAVIMVYTFYSVVLAENFARQFGAGATKTPENTQSAIYHFINSNPHIFVGFVLAIVSGYFGLRLFSKINANNSQVIRKEDRVLLEPLIGEANKDAIDQYIRLSSLSGVVGSFTKVGFTGLPLAMVALTIIFVGCALLNQDEGKDLGPSASTLFDMAKLTLGAFIGSFVQRQVEQRQNIAADGSTSTTTNTRLPV